MIAKAAKIVGIVVAVAIGLMVIELLIYGPDEHPKNSIIQELANPSE